MCGEALPLAGPQKAAQTHKPAMAIELMAEVLAIFILFDVNLVPLPSRHLAFTNKSIRRRLH